MGVRDQTVQHTDTILCHNKLKDVPYRLSMSMCHLPAIRLFFFFFMQCIKVLILDVTTSFKVLVLLYRMPLIS